MDWSVLTYRKLGVCILLVFIFGAAQGSNNNPENDRDYVTFKLFFDRNCFGDIRTICIGNVVYINLPDMMAALGYSCEWEVEKNRFSTCCPTSTHCFTIRQDSLLRNDTTTLLSDSVLICDEESIYLLNSHFKDVCSFEVTVLFQVFRLRIDDTTEHPKTRLIRQKEMRDKAFGRQDDLQMLHVDTLPLNLSRLSSVGYSLSANTSQNGSVGYSGVLSANGEFLKGSLNLNYSRSQGKNYQSNQFTFKQDYGINKKFLKQVSFFRHFNTFTMDLGRFTNGVYLSNSNTQFLNQRYYLYKGQTRPNANVEIYNNKILVAYVSADSVGHYSADIPVTNGSNTISTLTLNDYGEALSEQKIIYMPLFLQPKHKFMYSLSTGYADDGQFYSGLYTAYGITNKLTFTTMTESEFHSGHFNLIGGIGFKLAFNQWLQAAADYIPTLKYNISLTGIISKYTGYSLSYEKYKKGQKVVFSAPLKNINLDLNLTFPIEAFDNSLMFNMGHTQYEHSNRYTSSIRASVSKGSLYSTAYITGYSQRNFIPANLTFGGNAGYRINKQIYTNFSYCHYTKQHDNLFSERLQYQLTKHFFANAELQYQTANKNISVQLGFTYRFPWMAVGSNLRTNNSGWTMNNSISGGISFYGTRRLRFSDQAQSGSTLCVVMYVDRNGNQCYDKEEEIIQNPKVKILTGGERVADKNGVYFRNILPYQPVRLSIPRQVFNDISWQITPVDTVFCLSPYQSHTVYFPVQVLSEVSGEVFVMVNGKRSYRKNILIGIVSEQGGITRVRTDDWGLFDYTGLTAGKYRITVLSSNVKVRSKKEHEVVVPEQNEGVELGGIDFELDP